MNYSINEIHKIIKSVPLDFSDNPSFVSFRLLVGQGTKRAVKKLQPFYPVIKCFDNYIAIYK